MNPVKTINNQVHPVALRRSIHKVNKDSSPNEIDFQSLSTPTMSSPAHYYSNFAVKQNGNQVTKIKTNSYSQDSTSKPIRLVINGNNQSVDSSENTQKENDWCLSTLIAEYQASLNRKDCPSASCHRFKLLSYKISQALFERINSLKADIHSVKSKNNNNQCKTLPTKRTSIQSSCSHNQLDNLADDDKDKIKKNDTILGLEKQIEDLERQVEDQKRLRLQDASQVEEKAAQIKEWVANKLKVLENQNKQLRDQNRKQEETIKSLRCEQKTVCHISSPLKVNINHDSTKFINQSPVQREKLPKNLRNARSMKPTTVSSSSEDENQNDRHKADICNNISKLKLSNTHSRSIASLRDDRTGELEFIKRESPVYDSVAIEQINRRANVDSNSQITGHENTTHYSELAVENKPPPPPLHQSDKWEMQLYSLADESLSSLLREPDGDDLNQLDSIGSSVNSEKGVATSRKSFLSTKYNLISIVNPSFTNIDGDHVIDTLNFEEDNMGKECTEKDSKTDSMNYRDSNDRSSESSVQMSKSRKESFESCENIDKPSTPNLFDSPMRQRYGRDCILRTQSLRRNPAPEKLFDFISADLVKRGYLIKPGALKSHNRWFVLKDFHLYSYKNESEETIKATPNMKLKLEPSNQVYALTQNGESSFPLKIIYSDKTLQLIASTASARDNWVKMLTVAISMSDIEPDALSKHKSTYESIMSITRHGHTKKCYATLINHVLFFLKSPTDPTPMSYLFIKGSKIREVTDNHDYDVDEQELLRKKSIFQDCSLAIYPKYSSNPDPVYITLGGQQDIDKWFYFLSLASGTDQSYGTQFERTLAKLMINNSISKKITSGSLFNSETNSGCLWKEHSYMLYTDRPIIQPLTSLPNETLKGEAIELFKSILLFTQVPLEPIAIDYHVSLLQNCIDRILKYPELRNEFYAQLVKQCTLVAHRCNSSKLSYSSSGFSSTNQRSSVNSSSTSSSECQFVTDVQLLDVMINNQNLKLDANPSLSQLNSLRDKTSNSVDHTASPSQSELIQVMQILSVAVSLNLPRGRMRWWLMDCLSKFATTDTNIGKYALYTMKAIDRTLENGTRDNVPSRTEIMSILLRNPYNHSNPHSLPVNFSDGSYLVVEADGSTTIDEFMNSMIKNVNIRHSLDSDFYLFADDPSGSKDLYLLESQRKVLDVVGWWEQAFRKYNSGRYQNTRAIKIICKKRLILKTEAGETQHERLLIVHQINQEVVSAKIPLSSALTLELAAIMAQLNFGDYDKSKDAKMIRCLLESIAEMFLPDRSSQLDNHRESHPDSDAQLAKRWQHLAGKSTQDCIRVYLNCIRRLKLSECSSNH